MITYSLDKIVDYSRLVELFEEAGWHDKTRDSKRLKTMVENSQAVVTAWDGELMVGFARCVTDFVFNGQINNVVVDLRYRGHGIGRGLIQRILESSKDVTYILRGDPENQEFYKSMGFEYTDLCLVYKRKK